LTDVKSGREGLLKPISECLVVCWLGVRDQRGTDRLIVLEKRAPWIDKMPINADTRCIA